MVGSVLKDKHTNETDSQIYIHYKDANDKINKLLLMKKKEKENLHY